MNNHDLPEGFKMTELGPLPEGWEVVRLGQLEESRALLLKNGFACGTHNDVGVGVPQLRPMNVNESGDIALNNLKYVETDEDLTRYLLQANDVIFNNTNSEELVGKTSIWLQDGKFVVSNHMTIIRVLKPEVIEPYYLARHLHWKWFDGYYRSICRRYVAQAGVSLERLRHVSIPLPPLPEQRAIAQVLRTVQRAKQATERVLAAARELKKSLMRHLFTYGRVPIDQAGQVRLKETELGPLPEHWEVVRLGEVVVQTQYGLSRKGEQRGRYPILRMNNLKEGTITTNDLQYIDLPITEFRRFRVNREDLLFNRTNSAELVGKTAIFELQGDYVFASYLIRVVVDRDQLLPVFLKYYLNSDWIQARLKGLASRGVSQSNISATKLKTFFIPLPPLPEQQAIAEILRTVDRKIQTEERRKAALDALFKTLLHHLMTGRVRVRGAITEPQE